MTRWLCALAVVALVWGGAAAYAQATSAEIDAKVQQIDSKLNELNQLKTELEGIRASLGVKPAPGKKPWTENIRFTGYSHFRYIWRDNAGSSRSGSEFYWRRMYINLIGKLNPRTTAVVTWARIGEGQEFSAETDADWAVAMVDYRISPDLTFRFGQAPDWFGLETAQSSADRVALDRAAVLEGGRRRPYGMYFQGPWDRGAWIYTRPAHGWCPQAIAGIFNGQFRNRDADNGKVITIDLKWVRPQWQFGASWLDGKFVGPSYATGVPVGSAVSTGRRAWLGYARWQPSPAWAVQGEYLKGQLLGNDIDGWYAQLEQHHTLAGRPGTGFVKFEGYDSGQLPHAGATDDQLNVLHVGYAYQLDANNELTAQWSDVDWGGDDLDETSVQWQFAF